MLISKWQKRDALMRRFFFNSELSKLILRSLLADSFFIWEDKMFFFLRFQKYTFRSSISFYSRSCLFTGHSRSVFKTFKLSRHQAKASASNGLLIGLRKSSF